MRKFVEPDVADNPLYHDTWKLLKPKRAIPSLSMRSLFRMHFPAFQNRTLKRYSARWLTSYLRKGFPAFLARSPAISYIPYRTTAGKS